MAKRIYIILGIILIAALVYFILNPGDLAVKPLVWIVTLLYASFVGCLHGLLAHTLTPKQKGSLMFYPLIMGILFGVLSFIYIFIVLPLIVPGFM